MKLKKSVSFWSYMTSYNAGRMNVEDMVAAAAKAGATGIEGLPNNFNMCHYPNYTQEDCLKWKELLAKYNMEPACLSSIIICLEKLECGAETANLPNLHIGASREEMFDLMKNEIQLTHDLGFNRMRHPLMSGIPMDIIEELLPMAEDLGIALDLEIHSPYQFDGPEVERQIEMIERSNLKLSGLIPDLNAIQDRLPKCQRDRVLAAGADETLIKEVDAALLAHENMPEISKQLLLHAKDDATIEYIKTASLLRPDSLEKLRPLAKYVHYFHGKFFDIDENLNETCLDYPMVLRFLDSIGYDGWFCSEYEGWGSHALGGTEEVEQVERHIKMLEKLEAEI